MSDDMPRWLRWLCSISARPLRAAVPRRSMSSEEGGVVWGSTSSRVLRTRSRRGSLPAGASPLTVVLAFVFTVGWTGATFIGADLFRLEFFGVLFRTVVFGARALVLAFAFTGRLAAFFDGRLAERRADAAFRVGLAGLARRAALRLAMA